MKNWAGNALEESTSESGNWVGDSDSKTTHEKSDVLHASCHCGGVSFGIARPDEHSAAALPPSLRSPNPTKWIASNDVCTSCRVSSGCSIFSWTFPTVDRITLADGSPYRRLFGTMKEYHSSPDVQRTFCGVCGAKVAYHSDDRPQMVDVAVGLLEAPEGARAESWLDWRTSKLTYEEDVIHPAMIAGFKEGLKIWGEKKIA